MNLERNVAVAKKKVLRKVTQLFASRDRYPLVSFSKNSSLAHRRNTKEVIEDRVNIWSRRPKRKGKWCVDGVEDKSKRIIFGKSTLYLNYDTFVKTYGIDIQPGEVVKIKLDYERNVCYRMDK